ncbi:hypothetical protein MNB_SV-13-893 [hydrothermal vent metagenome]|uniref:Uncharacterized protein n=1 Tax=hydrothermal vent metagenome TaxID=652676 RepID=A0A1W1CZQ2_9ZZZZ
MSKTTMKLLLLLSFVSIYSFASSVPAYYDASFSDAKTIKSKLQKAGFKVLSTYSPAGKSSLKILVFTNKALKSIASKKSRGFASIQRVMIDSKAKTVRVTNPTYWLKAFMQKDFKAGSDTAITASLTKALGKLNPSKDNLKEGKLSSYHFMIGMPYYEDMIEVSATPKKKLFELKLANGAKLIAVSLPKSTESFINKIGVDKAILLPYMILLEGGKAYALHPKYYISLSYPLLSMGQFMDISNIPDAIEKALK